MNAPFNALAERFHEPEGWNWGTITPRDDQTLRYGWAAPKNPHGLISIYPGLSEYIEKYFEVAQDLLSRGYAVMIHDWRGQGLSWRHLPNDRQKRFHDDFAVDVADGIALLRLIDQTPQLKDLPRMCLAHSMGGHIALRIIKSWPESFKQVVMTAPMIEINLPFNADRSVRNINTFFCKIELQAWHPKLNGNEWYIFGEGPWNALTFEQKLNVLSSDGERREMQRYWLNKNPDLRMGGVTNGWLNAAFKSTLLTRDPAWLADIQTPILLVLCSREVVISNQAIRMAASTLPQGKLLEVEGSLHEVLMEKDVYRNQFWQGFDAFVAKQRGPR